MIIGDPVAQSLSPTMHNAGYEALGVDDQFVFVGSRVEPKDLADAVRAMRTLQVRGLTCTIPHKVAVMKHLDAIDGAASMIGAVNTVVNDDGVLTGYNTDWYGAVRPLRNGTSIKGKKVALLGAGGAARAIAFGMIKEGAELSIYARDTQEASSIAGTIGGKVYAIDRDIERVQEADILIHATPVGMAPDDKRSIVPPSLLHKDQIVFDIVYKPLETRLLCDARACGAETISGIEMLLYQGVEQFRLYTGMEAPESVMRRVLEERST